MAGLATTYDHFATKAGKRLGWSAKLIYQFYVSSPLFCRGPITCFSNVVFSPEIRKSIIQSGKFRRKIGALASCKGSLLSGGYNVAQICHILSGSDEKYGVSRERKDVGLLEMLQADFVSSTVFRVFRLDVCLEAAFLPRRFVGGHVFHDERFSGRQQHFEK